MAKLFFRYGAMNSGKSTALMQVAFNYEERGMSVKVFKPMIDTKGGLRLLSRLGVGRQVDCFLRSEDDCFEVVEKMVENGEKIDCILIDEAQFLTSIQADQLLMVTVDLKIPVICYGLRTDFSGKGFPGSERLLLISHTLEEMKTICSCGKKAMFNGRKINGRFVFEGEQVAIDGEDSVEYESLCAECYMKEKKKWEEERKERIKSETF